MIDSLLEKEIIWPSNSEYASPIVLVRKKTGDLRLCIDYRELNKLLLRDNYPLPNIEDLIDSRKLVARKKILFEIRSKKWILPYKNVGRINQIYAVRAIRVCTYAVQVKGSAIKIPTIY